MSKKMSTVIFTFLLVLNVSYAGETQLKLAQNVEFNKLDSNDDEDAALQVEVITEDQSQKFSLYGYDPEVWGVQKFYFELSFDNHSVVLPLKLDEEYNAHYVEILGSSLTKSCDKITKNMYLLDQNKKRLAFFPYNKFGIACRPKSH